MLRKIRKRIQSEESGFTLIELLVVILIIGILAAIALPAFLGQQKKGQDAAAKSDVRNAVSQMETCFANTQTYAECDAAKINEESTGIDIVDGPSSATGKVVIAAKDVNTYTLTANSKSEGGKFTITKGTNGVLARTCEGEGGGCNSGTW